LLDGPDVVKYIKIKRLQYAGHIVQMPREVLNGKPHGRSIRSPQLRWEHIRRDSLLLLNTRGWRRLAGGRDIWR
jgi:hypothetical protein